MRVLIIITWLFLSVIQLNAQEANASYKFEVCKENCIYSIPVYFENAGTYTVQVISPKGTLQTTLMYKKELSANTNKSLSLNIKRWSRGIYMLKISDERGLRKFKKINIFKKIEKRH